MAEWMGAGVDRIVTRRLRYTGKARHLRDGCLEASNVIGRLRSNGRRGEENKLPNPAGIGSCIDARVNYRASSVTATSGDDPAVGAGLRPPCLCRDRRIRERPTWEALKRRLQPKLPAGSIVSYPKQPGLRATGRGSRGRRGRLGTRIPIDLRAFNPSRTETAAPLPPIARPHHHQSALPTCWTTRRRDRRWLPILSEPAPCSMQRRARLGGSSTARSRGVSRSPVASPWPDGFGSSPWFRHHADDAPISDARHGLRQLRLGFGWRAVGFGDGRYIGSFLHRCAGSGVVSAESACSPARVVPGRPQSNGVDVASYGNRHDTLLMRPSYRGRRLPGRCVSRAMAAGDGAMRRPGRTCGWTV